MDAHTLAVFGDYISIYDIQCAVADMRTERSGRGWKMRAERHSRHYTTDWRELPVANG